MGNAPVAREPHPNIDALRDGQGKAGAAYRIDGHAVGGDQFAFQISKVDEEICAGAAVDNPQTYSRVFLDANDLGIGQGAVVDEVGIIVDVVGVRLAHRHAFRGHISAHGHRFAAGLRSLA